MRTSFRPSRGNVAVAVLALAVLVVIGELAVRAALAPAASAALTQPSAAALTQQGAPATGTPAPGRTPWYHIGTPPSSISLPAPPGNPVKVAPDEPGGLVSPAAIARDVTGTRAFNGTVITRAEVVGKPTVSGGTETAEVNETISGGGVVYRMRWAYDVSGGTWTATPEYQVSPGA